MLQYVVTPRVCLSRQIFLESHHVSDFHLFSVQVLRGPVSVLLWGGHYNMMCTSFFVDDVTFAHNGFCSAF